MYIIVNWAAYAGQHTNLVALPNFMKWFEIDHLHENRLATDISSRAQLSDLTLRRSSMA
jgi:hypothetical protein